MIFDNANLLWLDWSFGYPQKYKPIDIYQPFGAVFEKENSSSSNS